MFYRIATPCAALLLLFVLVTCGDKVPALTLTIGSGAIALVQNGAVAETVTDLSTPVPFSLAASSTAGTMLVAVAASGGTGSNKEVTAMPAGWASLVDLIEGGTNSRFEIWVYPNNPGGILNVNGTATSPASGARWWTQVSEWSGVLSASYLDASGSTTAAAGTTLVPTTSAALVASKSLVIAGWLQQIAASATVTFTSPAGFTRLVDTSALARFQHLDVEYMLNPTPGAILGVTLTSNTTTTSAAGGIIVLAPRITSNDFSAYLAY